MEHLSFKWIKKYVLDLPDEILEFHIASNKVTGFTGILVYCEYNKLRKNSQTEPAYKIIVEYFFDITEIGAYNKITYWLDNKFGAEYKILEKETKEFE